MRHILRNIFNIQLPFIKLKSIILRRIVKFIQLGSQKFSGLIILYLKIIMVENKKIDYSTSNHQVYSTWIAKVCENFRKQD